MNPLFFSLDDSKGEFISISDCLLILFRGLKLYVSIITCSLCPTDGHVGDSFSSLPSRRAVIFLVVGYLSQFYNYHIHIHDRSMYSFCYDNEKENQRTRVIPGVGGVLPREGSAPGCAPGPPKLPLDEPFVAYSLDDLAAEAWKERGLDPLLSPVVPPLPLSLTCMRICSSLTGLGMNPTSQPSLTNRPIHQLLSYFSWKFRYQRV